jgi:hypothetical protein
MKNILAIFLAGLAFSITIQPLPADGPTAPKSVRDNVLIDLSAALIDAAVERDFKQTDKVSDVIMGNPVYGTSRTQGKVGAALVPDAGNGVVDVFVRGTVFLDLVTVPPEKGLLVYSTANCPYIVRTRLYVNQTGFHSFPTQARVSANVKLTKVTTLQGQTGTLLTDLAEEAFEINKDKVEQITVDKTQQQLMQSTDEQFRPLLVQGNQAIAKGLQQIKDLGVPLSSFHFSTTNKSLTLGALLSAATLPSPAPQLRSPFDVAGRVHQSAVDETAQAVLAGKTFNVEELGNLGVKMMTVTFADRNPITVAFADQCAVIAVRIKEIRTAGLRLPGLTIRTTYKIENSPGRVELVRQGPVQVEPFYPGKVGERSLGTILQGSLDQVFKARIPMPYLQPPVGLSQIGTLVPAQGDAVNGWLTLTWIRKKS